MVACYNGADSAGTGQGSDGMAAMAAGQYHHDSQMSFAKGG